jgi:hypothetical protein
VAVGLSVAVEEAALSVAVWRRQQLRLRRPSGKAPASAVQQEVSSVAADWRQ